MKPVQPEVIRGDDYVAVKTTYKFEYAAPGWTPDSQWTQLIVFPQGKRYFGLIEEIHGKPVKAGESFSAAHIVGYFDDIDEMNEVYAENRGHTALAVDESGWRLVK